MRLKKMTARLTVAYAVLGASPGGTQPTPASQTIFEGRNVYSPSTTYDADSAVFKMWYGGWQTTADYPHDKIYYRTSRDGSTWSAPRAVLTPSQLPVASTHVNDPSVVKIFNAITKKPQYTMFYTVCIAPCRRTADNQLWTSVSPDGVNWSLNMPLIRTQGASEPAAIISPAGAAAVWRVYYSNTSEANNATTHILFADVDGNRKVLQEGAIAYTHRGPGVLANPEVRKIEGVWNLIFNVYQTRPGSNRNTADVYIARSVNPSRWLDGSALPLILNDPNGQVCATIAPAIVQAGDHVLLQFGQARYSASGVCDFSTFGRMQQLSRGTAWLRPGSNPYVH
jgi:hypothetical protein